MGQTRQLSNTRRWSVDTGMHRTLPTERAPFMHAPTPPRPAKPSRLPLLLTIGIPAVFILVVAVVVLVTKHDSDRAAPAPISRSELVARYSDLAPDPNATPSSIEHLANVACERLDSGVSPDDLRSSVAETYRGKARAQKVVHLLVSYGCPEHLDRL
jgi:hypothetical protein